MHSLDSSLLGVLPETVQVPAYDRSALLPGMAHIGVGAFHRCHQAEYTDDLLAVEPGRWGVVGINVREPRLSSSLGPQGGLYTRLCRDDDRTGARIVGSIVATVDSQDSPGPALEVLASTDIDVVTMTVTEKGYCHAPSTGRLDTAHPDIVHDFAEPKDPAAFPAFSPAPWRCACRRMARRSRCSAATISRRTESFLGRWSRRSPLSATQDWPTGSRATSPSRRPWSTG